jgi:hypothetical protein
MGYVVIAAQLRRLAMAWSKELVDITVILKHTTEKAVLVNDGTRNAWLPLSQITIHDDGGVAKVVTGPIWLFKDKMLI